MECYIQKLTRLINHKQVQKSHKFIPCWQYGPRYPGGHVHAPVIWSQVPLFWHWHLLPQSVPYEPWGHLERHDGPVKPSGQIHWPVSLSQVPPL